MNESGPGFEYQVVTPANIGWLQVKLDQDEIDYIWKCIDDRSISLKSRLAGNISASYQLIDKDKWFFRKKVVPLCNVYEQHYGNTRSKDVPCIGKHPWLMYPWWVNFQKEHDFNPVHNHAGIYSFVIWLKIPTDYEEQNKSGRSRDANTQAASNFHFEYYDILGKRRTHEYRMSPKFEGTMLFFPSQLDHCVYPFYDCKEDRVTVSGNIILNSTVLLNEDELVKSDGYPDIHHNDIFKGVLK